MFDSLLQYILTHENLVFWSVFISIITFVGTLLIVPALVCRIPVDYFSHTRREPSAWAEHHPVIRLALLFAKNLLGYVVILMGAAMLVLPGQGLLTIIIGLMLINFPGKYRLERWLMSRGPILRSANWLRNRAGYEALIVDEEYRRDQ